MRYDDHNLLDLLAREYVLGTLRGAARRRFDAVIRDRVAGQRAVSEWEHRLQPMSMALEPVVPPAHVWKSVEQSLGLGPAPAARGGLWGSVPFWRGLAAAFAVAVVVLAGQLMTVPTPTVSLAANEYVSIVSDSEGAPLWLIEAKPDEGRLRITAVGESAPPAGKSYELWMLPDDGAAPVSLGVLPGAGALDGSLSDAQKLVLAGASKLAVSLEPEGGSPVGAPTGPVLFVAPVVQS